MYRRRVVRRGRLEQERDRAGHEQQRRPDQREQQVLDHVQREQGRVVEGEAGVDRVQDHEHAGDPVDGAPPRHGMVGMGAVDPVDADPPQQQRRRSRAATRADRTSSRRRRSRDRVGAGPPCHGRARPGPARARRRRPGAPRRCARTAPGSARNRVGRRVSPAHSRASAPSRPRACREAPHAAPVGYDQERPAPRHGRRPSTDGETSFAGPFAPCGRVDDVRGTRCRCLPGHGPGPARSLPAC